MFQLRRHAGFLQKFAAGVALLKRGAMQQFDGDIPLQLVIHCLKNDACAAAPQFADKFVAILQQCAQIRLRGVEQPCGGGGRIRLRLSHQALKTLAGVKVKIVYRQRPLIAFPRLLNRPFFLKTAAQQIERVFFQFRMRLRHAEFGNGGRPHLASEIDFRQFQPHRKI